MPVSGTNSASLGEGILQGSHRRMSQHSALHWVRRKANFQHYLMVTWVPQLNPSPLVTPSSPNIRTRPGGFAQRLASGRRIFGQRCASPTNAGRRALLLTHYYSMRSCASTRTPRPNPVVHVASLGSYALKRYFARAIAVNRACA